MKHRRFIVFSSGSTSYVCDRVYLFRVVRAFGQGGRGWTLSRSRLLAEACATGLNAEHEAWLGAA